MSGVRSGTTGATRCTFDVMIEEFALGSDALARLAVIVRGADTGRSS